jgi:hypothetical protein
LSDPPDKKREPGDAAFEAIGWDAGPETLERDLLALYYLYQSNPDTNLAAFEALERIAMHWWDDAIDVDRPDLNFGMEPTTSVPVPWWLVHLIGRSWRNYRKQFPRMKVGQAFLLEGRKRGEHTQLSQFETQRKNCRVALEIAYRICLADQRGQKLSVEAAISEITSKFGISTDAAWSAWKEHGKVIQQTLLSHLREKFPNSSP